VHSIIGGDHHWFSTGENWWQEQKRNKPEQASSCHQRDEGNIEWLQPSASENRRIFSYKYESSEEVGYSRRCSKKYKSSEEACYKYKYSEEARYSRRWAQVAEYEDSNQEKIVMSPMSMVIKKVYPRLGNFTLENRQSFLLTWSNDATDGTSLH
jgi:hypothetical protein